MYLLINILFLHTCMYEDICVYICALTYSHTCIDKEIRFFSDMTFKNFYVKHIYIDQKQTKNGETLKGG